LWSKSPFDYTQRTGGEWEGWFTKEYPDYPCVAIPADREICCDFSGLALGTAPASPWSCPDYPQMVIGWNSLPAPLVIIQADAGGKPGKALCFEEGSE